ncbi:MAG: prepilin-type N-terminal cleavage/methylation domain-containing protein, partial [Candidatus Paceibacterota bacterium]
MKISQLFNSSLSLSLGFSLWRKLKSKRKNSEAFTLIELLVVVAIIGILSAMIFVSMTSAQATARDGRRQSELSQTKKALQSYYLQNGGYPATGADGISLEADSDTNGTFTQTMKSGGYMSIIPRDPKYTSGGEYTYKYIATTTEAYILCA